MKKIILKRGEGKTRAAMTLAHERRLTLVVRDRAMKELLEEEARGRGQDVAFMTFDDFLRAKLLGIKAPGVVIDDADELLQIIAGSAKVEAVTMSDGDL